MLRSKFKLVYAFAFKEGKLGNGREAGRCKLRMLVKYTSK